METSSVSPSRDGLDKEVILHYIDKAHDSFSSNRAYANRVLGAQTVMALLMIGIFIGATEDQQLPAASSDFSIDVWAVFLTGAIFVALTPGFVIGRLLYNADLAKEIQRWYGVLERQLSGLRDSTASPWEVAPLVSEAGWASARVFNDFRAWRDRGMVRKPAGLGERLGTFTDLLGGPLTFLALFAILPVAAQILAGISWWQVADSPNWGRAIAFGVFLLVLFTVASTVRGALLLNKRAEQVGASPFGQPKEREPSQPGSRPRQGS